MEERIDHKFTILLSQFERMHDDIVGFKDQVRGEVSGLKQQITDLRNLITTTGVGLLIAFVGLFFPIAFTLWTRLVHWP